MSKFKTIYDHAVVVSPHGGISLTDQQYKRECDINCILQDFGATGRLPVRKEGVSGDFSDVGDYQCCLDRINRAKDEFMSQPSDIRARFGNDPAAYVDFVLDPANVDECLRLGIMEKREVKRSTDEVLESIEKNTRKEVSRPKGEGAA